MHQQKPKRLKVSSHPHELQGSKVPSIHLCGNWMTELGFREGDPIKVTLREGLMIIELAEEEDAKEQVKYYRGILAQAIEELQAIRKL